MMRRSTFVFALVFLVFASFGCDSEPVGPSGESLQQQLAKGPAGPLPRPQIWADCELFNSIVAPATFHPESGPFDELYRNAGGFSDGVPLISESKPGDRDFNGGRWHLNVLKDGVPEDKYADACAVEDLDLDDFESTDNYFECPMLPRRGRHLRLSD